ncbi:MAG: hypothetical protein U5K38_06780 [Woeseiaceae bacterium]|nr:hypothetical protein [Woeseiaceae bacterium]
MQLTAHQFARFGSSNSKLQHESSPSAARVASVRLFLSILRDFE